MAITDKKMAKTGDFDVLFLFFSTWFFYVNNKLIRFI